MPGLRAIPGVNAAEPHRRRARMIAHAIAEGVGLQMRQPVITVRLSRTGASGLQTGSQLEAGARLSSGIHCS